MFLTALDELESRESPISDKTPDILSSLILCSQSSGKKAASQISPALHCTQNLRPQFGVWLQGASSPEISSFKCPTSRASGSRNSFQSCQAPATRNPKPPKPKHRQADARSLKRRHSPPQLPNPPMARSAGGRQSKPPPWSPELGTQKS